VNGVGRFIHVQRVSAHEMDERALCGRMVLDPLDLIGIDSNFLSASVKRDHLGHSCHLAEATRKPKGPSQSGNNAQGSRNGARIPQTAHARTG
jgi:hypothetical protein